MSDQERPDDEDDLPAAEPMGEDDLDYSGSEAPVYDEEELDAESVDALEDVGPGSSDFEARADELMGTGHLVRRRKETVRSEVNVTPPRRAVTPMRPPSARTSSAGLSDTVTSSRVSSRVTRRTSGSRSTGRSLGAGSRASRA